MTSSVRAVLGGEYGFDVRYAKGRLAGIKVDPRQLLAAYDESMAPAPQAWLDMRLGLMWKSSPVAGSIDAKAWMHETSRLLEDLPQEILADAIDTAVKNSARGFMPSVGEIRAVAEPKIRALRLERWRLQQVIDHEDQRTEKEDSAPRCTPEEARRITEEVGIKPDDSKPDRAHRGEPIAPDADWYRAHGVAEEDIPGAAFNSMKRMGAAA